MKFGIKRILIGGMAALFISLACSISVDLTPPPPTNVPVGTFVAQTLAASTQPGTSVTAAAIESVTFTPVSIESTSTSILTSTAQPTTVTTDALCYAGPGDAYEVVSTIKRGTQVNLIGKGAQSGWWILENPVYKDPCWIMKQFVSVDPDFDTSSLTVYAVPPTPTPTVSFLLQYQFLNICSGWDPVLSVKNTSGKTFRSYDAVVEDTNATTSYERKANDFGRPSGCSLSSSIAQLGPGQAGWVHVFGFSYTLVNKKLDATVTLCTETNQSGDCVTQSLRFTPQ